MGFFVNRILKKTLIFYLEKLLVSESLLYLKKINPNYALELCNEAWMYHKIGQLNKQLIDEVVKSITDYDFYLNAFIKIVTE